MEVTEVELRFKCPKCLRSQSVEFSPDNLEVEVGVEACPVHGSHVIISMRTSCPNCANPIAVELADQGALPDGEDE